MFERKWRRLQLFAEGAPAGDGGAAAGAGAGAAETGVTAPDAGEQELLKLGVPKNRITKRASAAMAQKMGKGSTRAGEPAQQAAAAAATEEGSKAAPGFQIPDGFTVDDVINHPDVNKALQNIIGKRVKDGKANAEAMTAMRPMLEVLARGYGLDPANLDYAALNKAVEDDGRYYEDIALARGVDIQTAKQMDAEERAGRQQAEELRQQKMQEQVSAWRQEEAQLKGQGMNIDLNAEAENPTFMNLLRAGFGVKGAYEAVHHAEILAAAKNAAFAQGQQETISQIRNGNHRPAELGSAQVAAAAPAPKLTQANRQSIRARLERGEKVDPREYGIV